MIMRTGHWALISLALAPLMGCAASQCDPSQADLFSGIGCQVSGAYAQRTAEQQAQLGVANDAAAMAETSSAQASLSASDAEETLKERRAQLRQLEKRTNSLQQRVIAARASNSVSLKALQQAELELNRLKLAQRQAGSDPDSATLAKIKARQAQLAEILAAAGQ